MKNIRFVLTSVFALLFLSGCSDFFSQTIEADPPEYEKALVFHTLVSNRDSLIRVNLSQTFGIFDASYFSIVRDAKVEWWVNGRKEADLLPIPPRPLKPDSTHIYEYRLPTPLQAGQRCEIYISHPDFKSVHAEQVMPGNIQTGTPVLVQNVSTDPSGTPMHEVTVHFTDEPGVKNYYEFLIYSLEKTLRLRWDPLTGKPVTDPVTGKFQFDTATFRQTYYFERSSTPGIQTGIGSSALLPDNLFDGQDFTFKGRFLKYNSGNIQGDSTKYLFIARQCTEAYYRWSQSYYKQYNIQGDPFAEPVAVFTNIENGLGIFGLFSEKRYELK